MVLYRYQLSDYPADFSFPVDWLRTRCEDDQSNTIQVRLSEDGNLPRSALNPISFVWSDACNSISVYYDGRYWLEFGDLAVFSLDMTSSRIEAHSNTDRETLIHLLLDQVIPRYISFRGDIVLHAGAVKKCGLCFAFTGESGQGKSSLTASFVKDGAALHSDDVICISLKGEIPLIQSIYPSLRLWPNAIEGLLIPEKLTSIMAHYSTKRRLIIDAEQAPSPLTAIFALNMDAGLTKTTISSLSQSELLMELIKGSFQLDPTDPQRSKEHFEAVSKLSSSVRGFQLSYPKGFENLPEVRNKIMSFLKEDLDSD